MKTLFVAFLVGFLFFIVPQEGISNNMPSTQVDTVYYIPGKLKRTARLFSDRENLSSVVLYIPADSTVQIIKPVDDYFLVHFQGVEGYILQKKVQDYAGILYEFSQPVTDQEMTQSRIDDLRYKTLVSKYGKETGTKIFEHKVWHRMTPEMVQDSWGKPHIINRYHDKEEWIYNKYILVFRDGQLVSMYPRGKKKY